MAENGNPYEPPATGAEAPRRHIGLRLIFLVPVLIYGSLGVLASASDLVVASVSPAGVTPNIIAGVALSATGAVFFITSAVMCWRGRWLYTCMAFALAIAAASIGDYLVHL